MEKRHIIFDFDGVIGNTYELNWRLIREIHPEVIEEGYRIDHHLGNVFETPVVPFTPESVGRYYIGYNKHLHARHVQDAVPTLKALASDFRFHVVSSNCETAIERVLKDAGVLDYFGDILGYAAHASKMEKFRRLAVSHGFALHGALFVTDTLGDLREAQKVALPSIAVTFGYHPRALLAQGKSFAIVDSWCALEEAIRTAPTR